METNRSTMNVQTKTHTATPWTYDKRDKLIEVSHKPVKGIETITATMNLTNGHGYYYSDEWIKESEANAAFIVKAVNNHDALVNALKACQFYMNDAITSDISGKAAMIAINHALKQVGE